MIRTKMHFSIADYYKDTHRHTSANLFAAPVLRSKRNGVTKNEQNTKAITDNKLKAAVRSASI